MNPRVLQRFLWGDYYYSEKKVFRQPKHDRHRPMFVQFVLDPLLGEYRKTFDAIDVSSAVEVKEARMKIKAQFTKWMPMEKGILGMVVQHLPSPLKSNEFKLPVICPALESEYPKYPKVYDDKILEEWKNLKSAIIKCSNKLEDPAVAYITKM